MKKNRLAFFIICCSLSSASFALEVASEADLSNSIAQDGINVQFALPTNGWRASEMSLTDTNGISASVMAGYTSPGTVVAKNVGFNTCTNGVDPTCAFTAGAGFLLSVDMVGDNNGVAVGGSPMLNASFTLTGGASKIRLFIDDIRLRNGQTGSTETVLVDFLQNYVDIVPTGSLTLMTMQLGGSETTGHMLHFLNGDFGTIDFGTIALVDATTSTNNLRFGFKLDEFNVTGAGFDINDKGLIFTDSNFGKGLMDITLSDVRVGGASAASMGSFGLQNVSVSNLAVTVGGKN